MPMHKTPEEFPANGRRISFAVIVQTLIIAAIVSAANGLVSAAMIDIKVGYLIQELKRVEGDGKETRSKVDTIANTQTRVVSQANEIHDGQNRRLERLENRK